MQAHFVGGNRQRSGQASAALGPRRPEEVAMTWRKNETAEQRAKRLARTHEYDQRPENKARRHTRQQTPEYKARNLARRNTPEAKARDREYSRARRQRAAEATLKAR
jgi:hypothetical protein